MPQEDNQQFLPEAVSRVFDAIHRATRLSVVVKIFDRDRGRTSEVALIPRERRLHLTPFCLETKKTRNQHCIECDLGLIPSLCVHPRPAFFHLCHAGATEMIIPVFLERRLSAIVYIGQFRTSGKGPAELPLIRPATQSYLLGLAPLLEAYIAQRLRTPRFPKETSPEYRRETIQEYLYTRLSQRPDLQSLADYLALSRTRTAHVVVEATGESFVALRDRLRLERAKDLLQTTYFKITEIAAECGFSSTNYFHRFFRKQTGLSPAAFRRQCRMEV